MSKYIVATLRGADFFDSQQKAKEEVDNFSSEFKGVFIKRNQGVEGVNVSGSFFSLKHEQLKAIAKKACLQERFVGPDNVFMAKIKNKKDEILHGGEYVACVLKGEGGEDSPYFETSENLIISRYPIVDNLKWKDIDDFGVISLDSEDFKYSINPNLLIIIDATTGTSMTVESPYVSISENNGHLSKLDKVQLLKSSVHRAVEMRQITESLGWDQKNIIVHPINETLQIRDEESQDVFKSPIPISSLENCCQEEKKIKPMSGVENIQENFSAKRGI